MEVDESAIDTVEKSRSQSVQLQFEEKVEPKIEAMGSHNASKKCRVDHSTESGPSGEQSRTFDDLKKGLQTLHKFLIQTGIKLTSPETAKEACQLAQIEHVWVQLSELNHNKSEHYTFGLLLQILGTHSQKRQLLSFSAGDWLSLNGASYEVHAGMANMLSWIQTPRASHYHANQRSKGAKDDRYGMPRKIEGQLNDTVIISSDELVRKNYSHLHKDKENKLSYSKVTTTKTTMTIMQAPPPCQACNERLGRRVHLPRLLDVSEIQVHHPKQPLDVSEGSVSKILDVIQNGQTYQSMALQFADKAEFVESHWAKMDAAKKKKYGAIVNNYKDESSFALSEENDLTMRDHEKAQIQAHVLCALEANKDVLGNHLFFHVGDVPVSDALIKGIYDEKSGLSGFKNMAVLFGPLHTSLSIAKLTMKKYYRFVFAEYRFKKMMVHKLESQETRVRYEAYEVSTPFVSLGATLLEFAELRAGWAELSEKLKEQLASIDNPFAALLLHVMEENIPLALDVIPAFKSGDLNAAIIIYKRLASVYLTLPHYSRYRKACIYNAMQLERWAANPDMALKVKQLLPSLLDIWIETFFAQVVQHLPRGRATNFNIIEAADKVSEATGMNEEARRTFGHKESNYRRYELQPESQAPDQEAVDFAKKFLGTFAASLCSPDYKYRPQISSNGYLAGYLFGYQFHQQIDLNDFPICVSSGAPETLCCICLEPLELCPEWMVSACKWEQRIKTPVVEQSTCPKEHTAHAVCMPKLREETIEKLKVSEAKSIIQRENGKSIKGTRRNLIAWLQNHHRASFPREDSLKPPECRLCTAPSPPKVCMICNRVIKDVEKDSVLTCVPQCRHRYHRTCMKDHELKDGKLQICPYRQHQVQKKLEESMDSGNKYWSGQGGHKEKETDDESR